MEIAWTPELRHLLATGVHVPLDGDEAAAIDDVSRQLAVAGIDPEVDEVTTLVRAEREKPTLS
jgi:hypothetical protein